MGETARKLWPSGNPKFCYIFNRKQHNWSHILVQITWRWMFRTDSNGEKVEARRAVRRRVQNLSRRWLGPEPGTALLQKWECQREVTGGVPPPSTASTSLVFLCASGSTMPGEGAKRAEPLGEQTQVSRAQTQLPTRCSVKSSQKTASCKPAKIF